MFQIFQLKSAVLVKLTQVTMFNILSFCLYVHTLLVGMAWCLWIRQFSVHPRLVSPLKFHTSYPFRKMSSLPITLICEWHFLLCELVSCVTILGQGPDTSVTWLPPHSLQLSASKMISPPFSFSAFCFSSHHRYSFMHEMLRCCLKAKIICNLSILNEVLETECSPDF